MIKVFHVVFCVLLLTCFLSTRLGMFKRESKTILLKALKSSIAQGMHCIMCGEGLMEKCLINELLISLWKHPISLLDKVKITFKSKKRLS